ncbi:hypothetical protein GN316_15430 [Xylophilus sp. Kf1]|nr:hypothetical protein [Xylophilus sp. Kf1]
MSAAIIEIWIRPKGTRRQAFYRPARSSEAWQDIQVKHADKALREGTMLLGTAQVQVIVSRETRSVPEHPAAASFRASAKLLNKTMDAINGVRRRRGAA